MGLFRKLLLILLIHMSAVAVIASVLPGISYEGGIKNLAVISLVFGGANLFIKPILKALALPIEIATIGLFTVVINAAMLMLAAKLVIGFNIFPAPFPGLNIDNFIIPPFMLPAWGTAAIGALLIGLMVSFLYWLTSAKD